MPIWVTWFGVMASIEVTSFRRSKRIPQMRGRCGVLLLAETRGW